LKQTLSFITFLLLAPIATLHAVEKPNIIVILADDKY